MLNKIKRCFISGGIAAGLLFAAWLNGFKKGERNEKLKNIETVQKNIAKALRVRALLGDSDYIRRLHEKYRRV